MKIYLKEKIGNPDLFTGRKKELAFLLNWVEGIKEELSQSRSLLSRRKTGKTDILQRLFNMVFRSRNPVYLSDDPPKNDPYAIDITIDIARREGFDFLV